MESWQARLAPLGVVVVGVIMFDLVPPALGIPLALLAIAMAWRYTPGFWRLVWGGLVGGVVAGVLILGPGFRLAMRIVAILEPTQTPAFTVEGTAFIVVGVGALMGGLQALAVSLLRPSLKLRSTPAGGILLGVITLAILLLVPGDVRSELFELGAGPVMNIPMFGGICMAYGLAAMALADRVASRSALRQSIGAETVAA